MDMGTAAGTAQTQADVQHEIDTGKEAGTPAPAQALANEIVHVQSTRPATYAAMIGMQPTRHSNTEACDAEGDLCTSEAADILGDGMARPESAGFLHPDGRYWKGGDIVEMAQGAQVAEDQESGDSAALSTLAQVDVLEPEVAFSDARAIFTDGVAGRSDEASTMGCGGQAQHGQHPAETAGLDTETAPDAIGSENNVGGDGNAFDQSESGVRANGARPDEFLSAAAK